MGTEDENTVEDINDAIEDSTPEIDYSKLDPEKIPHDIAAQTGAFRGLLSEKQALSQNAQVLQTQLNEQLAESETHQPPDPDEYISRAEMEKVLAQRDEAKAKEQALKDAEVLNKRQNASTEALVSQMDAKKAGEGLDAKTVLRETMSYLRQSDPEMLAVMMGKEDAAQRLYDYGVATVPDLRAKSDSLRTEKLLAALKTGGGARDGGETPGSAGNELLKMLEVPEEQLLNEIEKEEVLG